MNVGFSSCCFFFKFVPAEKKCFLVVTELCTYSFAYTVYGVHIILVPNVIDTYVNKVYIISSIKSLMVVKKYIKLSIL